MPRPRPEPIPIPTQIDVPAPGEPKIPDFSVPQNATSAQKILKSLLVSSFVKVDRNFELTTISYDYLPVLVLESLGKYIDNPDRFGRNKGSFDRSIKDYFKYLYQDNYWATKLYNIYQLYDHYKRHIRDEIDNKTIPDYLRDKGDSDPFRNLSKNMIEKGLIDRRIAIETEAASDVPRCRRIICGLTGIKCIEPEEHRTDEPYFFTGSTIFDPSGSWESPVTKNSLVAGGIGPNDYIPLRPAEIRFLFNDDVVRPSEILSVPPVTLLCSVSLMEHEHGNTERIYQAFQAGYQTAKLLLAVAGGTAGPLGVAVGIAGILISLAIALDGDDQLGDAIFRFDDVLSGNEHRTPYLWRKAIKGEHLGNEYEYKVTISYQSIDYDCPGGNELEIIGPTERTIRYMGDDSYGYYKFTYLGHVRDPEWKAENAEIIESSVENRQVKIKFRLPGTYEVSVEAIRDLDDNETEILSDSMRVHVNLESHPNFEIP